MKPRNKNGEIIIPAGVKPWPHERRAAEILANNGYSVRFLREKNILHTADFTLDEVEYELKSPTGKTLSAIERNLKRGTHQSHNIVFDSSRMKGVKDSKIWATLVSRLALQSTIKKLIYINKSGELRVLK